MPRTERPQNPHVEIRDIGIWRVVRVVRQKSNLSFFHWSWFAQGSHLVNTHVHLIRCVWTLTRQAIALAPIHVLAYFLAQIYQALDSVIDLYSSQILLDSVRKKRINPPTLFKLTHTLHKVQAVVATGDLQAHVANVKFALALKFAQRIFNWVFVQGILYVCHPTSWRSSSRRSRT